MNDKPIPYTQRWIMAVRPKTLPAAVAPVLVGWAVAYTQRPINWMHAAALLAIAVLLQVGANLVNDVVDFQKGLDSSTRQGPTRVTQAGLLTPRQVWYGVAVVFIISACLGLYLAWSFGWPVILMGLLVFAGAVAYSTGPFPLAQKGLGDLAVMVFFGWMAVCGTVFVLSGTVPVPAWLCATAVGALVTNILVVNNLRDIDVDKTAGRRTIPVTLGYRGGETEYVIMLILAYLVPLVLWLAGWFNPWVLLPLLTLFEGLRLVKAIHAHPEGPQFNLLLAHSARLVLIYSLLFSIGIIA